MAVAATRSAPIVTTFTPPDELRRSAFTLLTCVLILLSIGVVMVYSAAAVEAAETGQSAWRPLGMHGVKVVLGLVLMFTVARIDLVRVLRLRWPLYLGALVLLGLVLVPGIGVLRNGSRRWMDTQAVLGFALQPSEFAKLALVVWLAAFFARTPDVGASFLRAFLPAAAAVLIPGALILCETDFGTSVLLLVLGFLLLLLAGAKLHQLVLLALTTVPTAGLFLWLVPRTRYIVDRVLDWVTHHFVAAPPSATGLTQIDFAESALHVGGLAGVGLGAGRHKLFFLAEAENDFILSVIGEELGFIGTTAVLFLFALLLWSGRRVLLGVRHRFGFFIVAGVLITIAMQALMNIFVSVRWAPVKGIPLPFVSSGGSSLAVLCLGVGLILNVARRADHAAAEFGGGGARDPRADAP